MRKSLVRRNALIESALPIVKPIAQSLRKSLPPCFDLDDLISTGTFGLIRAAEKWDSKRGIPFPAYARFAVRGAMLTSIQANWRDGLNTELNDGLNAAACEPSIESDMGAAAQTAAIRAELAKLPVRERTIILRHYLHAERLKTIAADLHIRRTSTFEAHRAGLDRLRQSKRLREFA